VKRALFFLCFILLLTGCASNNNASQKEQDERVKVQNTTNEQVDREEDENKANHLEELAEGVPDVKNATALVIGDYAVIGIDVDKNLDRSEVGTIKYAVSESLKGDPQGASAIVVADPDLNARLAEVVEDFRNGSPLQGIMNELADITGRIMPEVPADNLEPQPKDGIEEPKDKLEEGEEKQLEKTQDRQSNYMKDRD